MANNGLDITINGAPPDGIDSAHHVNWQHLIFEPGAAWVDRLTRLAARRFANGALAEEAFNFALERISADEWKLLSSYSGRSSPGTFLVAVFNNAMEDFARTRFGRLRPPLWLARLGDLWKRVYRMLCLERMESETIVDWLSAQGQREPEQIREIIVIVKSRICHCGQAQGEVLSTERPEQPGDQQTLTETPESILEEQELAALLGTLVLILNKKSGVVSLDNSVSERALGFAQVVQQRWPSLEKHLALSDQEQLILRQVYQEGRKIPAVARAMGLPEHTTRRICKSAVERLRHGLQKAGISANCIRNISGE